MNQSNQLVFLLLGKIIELVEKIECFLRKGKLCGQNICSNYLSLFNFPLLIIGIQDKLCNFFCIFVVTSANADLVADYSSLYGINCLKESKFSFNRIGKF